MDIQNIQEVKALMNKISFVFNGRTYCCFTSGNFWYVNTLIHNLLTSAHFHEPSLKIGVFCTDESAFDACDDLNFKYFARVKVPELNIEQYVTGTDASTEGYTRLSFVKVVLCHFMLCCGVTPIWIDPDMAFIRARTIKDLIGYLSRADFVCAGSPEHMNSNLLLAIPSSDMCDLFILTKEDVETIVRHPDLHGDEDFFRSKLQNIRFVCVLRENYPQGCDVEYFEGAQMLHANCCVGLDQKCTLLRNAGAWYLETNPIVRLVNVQTPPLSPEFTVPALNKYPPFLEGELFEEYFARKLPLRAPHLVSRYLNATWTNLYCNAQFAQTPFDSEKLQQELDSCASTIFFTVVQYDRGVEYHNMPAHILIFGCCMGDMPIPLTYKSSQLVDPRKSWDEKKTFCSFVGALTHPVRSCLINHLKTLPREKYFYQISDSDTALYREKSADSKYCLAPRGFGRASFRFYEVLKLGSIPVYIWDDVEWLPFRGVVDYTKLCVSIHWSEISRLDEILDSITESDYENMRAYYKNVEHYFTYKGIMDEILREITAILQVFG